MEVVAVLDELQRKALRNEEIKNQLLATRQEAQYQWRRGKFS